MNFEYKHLVPENFSNNSKVWIYQSNRKFGIAEALEIETLLHDFVEGWMSHGQPIKGFANLFFGQFIVLMADVDAVHVGGCSTDESQRFIKKIEATFNVQLFDRTSLAFIIKEKIELLPLAQLNYAFENNFINAETFYFNNSIATKKDFLEKWIVPVNESWLKNKIPNTILA